VSSFIFETKNAPSFSKFKREKNEPQSERRRTAVEQKTKTFF